MIKKQDIHHLSLENKKVLLRVDFNVPIKDSVIIDDERIRSSLETIRVILKKGASIIILSHLGRPQKKYVDKLSLRPVAQRLSELLNQEVLFVDNYFSPQTKKTCSNLKAGNIIVLENLRFYREEEENNSNFAQQLAKLADIFINDAFGTIHRKHASIIGIPKYLPSAIGLLVKKEIKMFSKLLGSPSEPFLVIVGGAKIKTKASLLESILEKANAIVIGGKMAHTFLKSQNIDTGISEIEEDSLELAARFIQKAKEKQIAVYLPIDFRIAYQIRPDEKAHLVAKNNPFPDKGIALDIGPETTQLIINEIKQAKTIFWNGPMGLFEFEEFSHGTYNIAKAIAQSDSIRIIGGGDSIRAIKHLGIQHQITHLSTGGGASLNFLGSSGNLPGLSVINNIPLN